MTFFGNLFKQKKFYEIPNAVYRGWLGFKIAAVGSEEEAAAANKADKAAKKAAEEEKKEEKAKENECQIDDPEPGPSNAWKSLRKTKS